MSNAEGFAAVPNWMVRDVSFSGAELAVYTALASHSGPGGIFPSQEVLAEESRISVRKTRDALKTLIDRGVVERVRRSSRSGRMTDGYALRPSGRIEDLQPAGGAGSGQQPAGGAAATGTSVHLVPLIEEEPIKKSASAKRGSRMVEGWKPSAALVEEMRAKAPSVDVVTETENFVDYWVAIPGARGVKLDWAATWRTWMRRAHQRNVDRGWRPVLAAVVPDGQEWLAR